MAEFPAMPLWTDALLGDTGHLSHAEFGLYLRILILIWRSPNCQIPADPEWLDRRFPNHADALRTVMLEFCTSHGQWVTQKRLKREWEWLKAKKEQSKQAANARWAKKKPTMHPHSGRTSDRISERNADGMPLHLHPIESILSESLSPTAASLFDWPADHREVFWTRYPLKVGKKKALEALEKVRKARIPWPKLVAGVDRYAASVSGKEPRFIKHATTWLNGAHWDDVLPTSNGYHPSSETSSALDSSIFVKEGTPQWDSWQDYLRRTTGKGSPCVNFGWRFPTEWPPETTNQEPS